MQARLRAALATVALLGLGPAPSAFPQTPPSIQWQASFGGTGDDRFACLELSPDGGCLLGGWTSSGVSGNKTCESFGGRDYWVVRLDAGGARQWETNYGGATNDTLTVLVRGSDQGWILGGYSESAASGNKTSGNFGGRDYWVVKLDAHGVRQWETNYGGTSHDQLACIVETAEGGYLLGGHSSSDASGNKTSGRYGTSDSSDLWLVKTDAHGVRQWETNYGGTGSELLMCLEPEPGGGWLLAASSTSGASGNKTSGLFGGTDVWLVKVGAGGVKLWETNYGGSSWDEPRALRPREGGGYVLGAQSMSGASGNKSSGGFGDWDYWLVGLDAQGGKLWETNFGGSRADQLASLQPAGDNGWLLGGWSESGVSGNKSSGNYGLSDWWVLRANPAGLKVWETNFGGLQGEMLRSVQIGPDGGWLLGGDSSSTNAGNKASGSFGSWDYWVVKLAGPPPLVFVPGSLQWRAEGTFQFQISGGASGLVHCVESTGDFATWAGILKFTNSGFPAALLDTNAAGLGRRFYRVR